MRLAHVRIADNPDFIEPTLDRVRSMVIRNRNRPSILVWSMGNECGYGVTFERSLRWTKETDPPRLTHYESAFDLSRDREFDVSDIDLFEINEAFAVQVLGSARELGIEEDKLNISGGAIALGHPFSMTGARITNTLINNLQEQDKTFGVETMCVGGGQGMAMVIERLS